MNRGTTPEVTKIFASLVKGPGGEVTVAPEAARAVLESLEGIQDFGQLKKRGKALLKAAHFLDVKLKAPHASAAVMRILKALAPRMQAGASQRAIDTVNNLASGQGRFARFMGRTPQPAFAESEDTVTGRTFQQIKP